MNRFPYQAVILDLDGVLTQTAQLHARAWQQMFDEYLHWRGEHDGISYACFDLDSDYRRYVDGKPRYDGVRSFLESRGISLTTGTPADPPDAELAQQTVCGLGNRKNQIFLKLLDTDGVRVWEDAVAQLQQWQQAGLKLGVFSSSRNCERVLRAAGLWERFATKVDGNDLQRLGLQGKPAPDMLLQAAEQLGVDPAEVLVVEDAIAGIQAGRAGGFRWVVGVARGADPQPLQHAGADRVVSDLRELEPPPSALDQLGTLGQRLAGKRLALCLDYDGTLTPIVQRPEDATLSAATRKLLIQLAQQATVAIISGRDRRDVEQRVGIDGVVYAGSHGFDISGPDGLELQQSDAVQALPDLDAAERDLRQRMQTIPGAQVERKKFAIAVHYRQVPSDQEAKAVATAVAEVGPQYAGLRVRGGKKIFELQPDVRWDKGHAVLWLIDALGLRKSEFVVIYIGDDVTDEDAFAALRDTDLGIGIRVGGAPTATAARYQVRDCQEVNELLASLQEKALTAESS